MRILLLILLSLVLLNCNEKPLFSGDKIKELDFLRNVDTIKINRLNNIHSMRYFVIENYSDKSIELVIDKFIKTISDKLLNEFNQYDLIFYKESAITNEKHLKEKPKDIDRYSQQNDLIFIYSWSKEMNTIYKYKYSKGAIVLPQLEILIEDIE